jgi:hypothetical protein
LAHRQGQAKIPAVAYKVTSATIESNAVAALMNITRSRILLVAGIAGFVGWLGAFVWHEASTSSLVDRSRISLGRDFLAFYSAGQIVRSGQGREFYDGELQRRRQAAILAPEKQGGYHYRHRR